QAVGANLSLWVRKEAPALRASLYVLVLLEILVGEFLALGELAEDLGRNVHLAGAGVRVAAKHLRLAVHFGDEGAVADVSLSRDFRKIGQRKLPAAVAVDDEQRIAAGDEPYLAKSDLN